MPHEIITQAETRVVGSGVTAITLDAKGNYSSGGIPQGSVVKKYTSGSIDDVVVATSGDFPDGVVISHSKGNGPGLTCTVVRRGRVKVLAGAAITLGDLVMVGDSSGRVETISADGATSVYIVGQAVEAATGAGDLIMVDMMIGSQHVTS